jgi:hypothetical protein
MLLIAIGVLFAGLLIFGVVHDLRARRKGHRLRDAFRMAAEAKDNRRAVRAWKRGAQGNLQGMPRPDRRR